MNIINFVLANWDSVLVVLAVIGVILWLIFKGEKSVINQIIYRVVTELEREYGGGTGSLKLAAAIDTVYPKLPAVIRLFVSAKTLQRWIEEGLAAAKEEWAKNSALAEYIGTATDKPPDAAAPE